MMTLHDYRECQLLLKLRSFGRDDFQRYGEIVFRGRKGLVVILELDRWVAHDGLKTRSGESLADLYLFLQEMFHANKI